MAATGKKVTIKGGNGKKPLSFKAGGLHESLGVPAGQPIPPGKMRAALAGKNGPKAKAQATFAKEVLTPGRKTAARNRARAAGKGNK